jgi:hypothetical protein
MSWLKTQFQKEIWSPYVAGALLGIVGILAVALANQLLGASGAFENMASILVKAVAPDVWAKNVYFQFQMKPEISFPVILLLGVFLGGMLGSFTSGTFKIRWNTDDKQWIQIFGPQLWKRYLIAFLGAIVLEYAAGIAGGCTSGLAISGGMLLAPAAYLFIAGMFASGIVTALVVYGKRY